MAHEIFISYAREDQSIADAVSNALEEEGLLCWIDHRDIASGRQWREAIVEAITASRVVVLVFSHHANCSRDVSQEVGIAFDEELEIVPFRVDDSSPSGSLEYCLNATQWLDATTVPIGRALENLRESIRTIISHDKTEGKSSVSRRIRTRQGNIDFLLDQAIEAAPLRPSSNFGYLHLVARPTIETDDLFVDVSGSSGRSSTILGALKLVSGEDLFQHTFSPAFSVGSMRNTTKGCIVYMGEQPDSNGSRHEYYTLDLKIGFDGDIQLFCGRAAERRDSLLQIFDSGIAETTVRFLAFAGCLYHEAEYLGPCGLGVAITGISGAISHSARIDLWTGNTFEEPSYRRTIQTSAQSLNQDVRAIARSLLSRFFHATLGGKFDPLG